MLNRVRRLNISLAAKLQLLFGTAVVMIIGAALLVPWQRMEQLTTQLNDTAASAIADAMVRQHLVTEWTRSPLAPRDPTNIRPARANGVDAMPPRLVGVDHGPTGLTAWERHVLDQLQKDPTAHPRTEEYRRRDGTIVFRYAQVVTLQQDCLRCHADESTDANRWGTLLAWDPLLPHAPRPAPSPLTATLGTPRVLGFVAVDLPSQIRTSQRLLNRVFLLSAFLLAGTLAIVVFYLITTRLILQPVRVLQETAEKVALGNLDIRSAIYTGDEFQQLSETFNAMLANLTRNADQLRQINKSLDAKIGQLAESNVALYESNRLKSEFLANVSHELRTPLNSILGFAELLKDVTAADARSGRYVQNILGSGKNLLDLINDLLDLAKIEAGRMEVRAEPLSLGDLFEGLTSILKPVTAAKQLSLTAALAADVPILQTDPPKLQQVLYNFLSNAIKFSPPDGVIDLRAALDADGRIRISVSDQGPGIELDKQQLIFDKFRQIDGSVTREHSGTGLGLAISKELTALLDGEIGVRSTPGNGATFWIVLPQKIQPSVKDVRQRMMLT